MLEDSLSVAIYSYVTDLYEEETHIDIARSDQMVWQNLSTISWVSLDAELQLKFMFCRRIHSAGLHWSSFTLETKQDLNCIKCFCFHLGPPCCTEYCLLGACGCYHSHSHLMPGATGLKESSLCYQCWAEIPSPSFSQHNPGTPWDEPGLGYNVQILQIYRVPLLFLATFLYSGEWLEMESPADFPGCCCAPGTLSQEKEKGE